MGPLVLCAESALGVAFGDYAGGQTEQIGMSLNVTNRSQSTCRLMGFPTIVISDAKGRVLPFVYDHSGNQSISGRAPTPVDLAPGATAYVAMVHNSCVDGDKALGPNLSVILPNASALVTVGSMPDGRYMSYCGAGDRGSTVYVSPVVANFAQALTN